MKFLKDKLDLRLYQQAILATAKQYNTLVVIPTGLGKTFIAGALAGLCFKQGKILFMAPTKPLCVQHHKTLSEFFEGESTVLTGAIPPTDRKFLWKDSKIIFATPQTAENDLIRNYFNFKDFSLVIFDEAHRATGEYAYVWLAKQASKVDLRILALTASPASDKYKLDEVRSNLRIEKVEVRSEGDLDVTEYVKHKDIKKIEIELPPSILEIKELFEKALKDRLKILKDEDIIESMDIDKVRKRDLLMLQGQLANQLGDKDPKIYRAISISAGCIKLQHSLELLQTQGIGPLVAFLSKLGKQSTKASKSLLADWNFKKGMSLALDLKYQNVDHPKFSALGAIVRKNLKPKSRIIVFTQYISSVDRILESLESVPNAKPVKFIGQKEGMSQKKQVEVLEQFKEGEFNILICTSIGEEGLDIKSADIGVFFEPVPSALRKIQRSGRIGRASFGKVYVLVTKDTIDEKYFWVSKYKEKQMYKILNDLKKEGEQASLEGFE